MAATCEERGIKHVKDVFGQKSNSITFMARRPMAPMPPSKTSAGKAPISKPKETPKPASETNGFTNGLTNGHSNGLSNGFSNGLSNGFTNGSSKQDIGKIGGDLNNKEGRGAVFLRADKDKHINTLELPVPMTPARKPLASLESTTSAEEEEHIYMEASPVTTPTSPFYATNMSPLSHPAYTSSKSNTNTSPGYSSNLNKYPSTKYPAPPVPGAKSNGRGPKVPGYSKALANLQSSKTSNRNSGVYSTNTTGRTMEHSDDANTGSDSQYVHHVLVHNSDAHVSDTRASPNVESPVYSQHFDFAGIASSSLSPAPVDNDVGSLFSGYDTQDVPYTPPLAATSPLNIEDDKPNNNTTSLFKKSSKAGKQNGGPIKRLSSDETNSSLAASSGYHSEFGSELEDKAPKVDRSKGHQNLNSSFDEDECTLDFADDDELYAGGQRHALYQQYEGEDFAKYLDDDSDRIPQPNTTSLARKVQRRRQQYLDKSPRAPKQYSSNTATKPGLKHRLSQALTLTRGDKNKQQVYQPKTLTNIHQFSFMDSKMGNYADEQEIQDYMSRDIETRARDAESRSAARDMETRSDLGGVRRRDSAVLPTWHNDTLSMSTLRKAKKLLDNQHHLSNSVPNLHKQANGSSARASTPDLTHKGESYSDFGADIKRKKKVNRFKFWKLFAKKKDKSKDKNDCASSLGFDEPTVILDNERMSDVHL